MVQGRDGQAEPLLRQAITALEQTGNLKEWVQAQAYHGAAVAFMGDMQGAWLSCNMPSFVPRKWVLPS